MLKLLPQTSRIELAAEPPFQLGPHLVTPALLQIASGDQSLTVEPRVMQVLVALAEEPGRVVSRADLVERCWDGRIVGENAIQRVISRIRHMAAELGGFDLETITKVGYRLRVAGQPLPDASATASEPSPQPVVVSEQRLPRRTMILGAFGIAAAIGAAVAWQATGKGDADSETAKLLVRRARDALGMGLKEQTEQAIAFLKRATELDPGSADAWGQLSRAYHCALDLNDGPSQQAYADWTRSAAQRALALDPANIDAKVSIATIKPNFRNWAENEAKLREILQQYGSREPTVGELGWLLCDTGRWQEALGFFRQALAFETLHPANQLMLAWGLWGSGNLSEAERVLDNLGKVWPQHRAIWQTRVDFLVTSGQTEKALTLTRNYRERPVQSPEYSELPFAAYQLVAAALDSGSAAQVGQAVDAIVEHRRDMGTYSAVTYLLALGEVDKAYPILEGYFFGDGERPVPGPLSRRKTSILFSEKGKRLREHPGYESLLERVGLKHYWRQTGTRPDFAI